MSDDNLTGNNQCEISKINELIFLDINYAPWIFYSTFSHALITSIRSITSKHIFLNGFRSRASNTIKRFLH